MLLKLNFFLFHFLLLSNVWTQNLIPNPSFEDKTECKKFVSNLSVIDDWIDVEPEVYVAYCGHHDEGTNGHDGSAYIVLHAYWEGWGSTSFRQYAGVYLTETLTAGTEYHCEFWVKTDDVWCVTTNSFGLFFSNGIPATPNWNGFIPQSPQITNPDSIYIDNFDCWRRISGSFIANGDENFMTVGNFNNDANSNLLVGNCDPPKQERALIWVDDFLLTTDTSLISEVFIDSSICEPITTYSEPSKIKECEVTIPNVLTINNDGVNENFELIIDGAWEFAAVNRWGEIIYQTSSDLGNSITINGFHENGKKLNNGVYFYRLLNNTENCQSSGHYTIIGK